MKDAKLSTSLTTWLSKCRWAMLANTVCTSPTSASTGVRIRTSSSKSRELRRRLCSLDSRRGRFAGVVTTGGLVPRDELLRVVDSSKDGGGGGSCIDSGDGCTIGIRSYCTRYRCKASIGRVVKSITGGSSFCFSCGLSILSPSCEGPCAIGSTLFLLRCSLSTRSVACRLTDGTDGALENQVGSLGLFRAASGRVGFGGLGADVGADMDIVVEPSVGDDTRLSLSSDHCCPHRTASEIHNHFGELGETSAYNGNMSNASTGHWSFPGLVPVQYKSASIIRLSFIHVQN